jgi:hypothetical protein
MIAPSMASMHLKGYGHCKEGGQQTSKSVKCRQYYLSCFGQKGLLKLNIWRLAVYHDQIMHLPTFDIVFILICSFSF